MVLLYQRMGWRVPLTGSRLARQATLQQNEHKKKSADRATAYGLPQTSLGLQSRLYVGSTCQ